MGAPANPCSADRKLTSIMMAYWSNFIRSGDPNGPGLPAWPEFERNAKTIQLLDTRIRTEKHSSLALCDILMPRNQVVDTIEQ